MSIEFRQYLCIDDPAGAIVLYKPQDLIHDRLPVLFGIRNRGGANLRELQGVLKIDFGHGDLEPVLYAIFQRFYDPPLIFDR